MNKTKRFIIEEEIIKDTKTGITWQRDLQKYGKFNFTESLELAKKENKSLPSREDLKTLNNGKYPTVKTLEEIGFINAELWYWTSDEYDKNNAWFIYIGNSYDFCDDKTHINCVTLIKKMEKLKDKIIFPIIRFEKSIEVDGVDAVRISCIKTNYIKNAVLTFEKELLKLYSIDNITNDDYITLVEKYYEIFGDFEK